MKRPRNTVMNRLARYGLAYLYGSSLWICVTTSGNDNDGDAKVSTPKTRRLPAATLSLPQAGSSSSISIIHPSTRCTHCTIPIEPWIGHGVAGAASVLLPQLRPAQSTPPSTHFPSPPLRAAAVPSAAAVADRVSATRGILLRSVHADVGVTVVAGAAEVERAYDDGPALRIVDDIAGTRRSWSLSTSEPIEGQR